jgi:hypothetical protein
VPFQRAFARLHDALDGAMAARNTNAAPSIHDVEAVLDKMQLHMQQLDTQCAVNVDNQPANVLLAPTATEPAPGTVTELLAPVVHAHTPAMVAPSVDDLFTKPATPLLQQHPECRQWARRTFDMSKVRRSARLAKKSAVPVMERAQRNLWRKLGVTDDEMRPRGDTAGLHQLPPVPTLPEHIIAAMTTALFDLEDEGADMVNEALLQYVGQSVADVQNELYPAQE